MGTPGYCQGEARRMKKSTGEEVNGWVYALLWLSPCVFLSRHEKLVGDEEKMGKLPQIRVRWKGDEPSY
jgi:hypothetical protein